MDESGGFFKVYRKAQQSAFWTKKPYVNYRGVWLTMLMMTNWKEGFFDGHTIKVGQFATSTESLSKACGLSIKQVRNVVDTMKEMGMVTVENVANRFSIVTICNWATYNGEESRKGQTEGKLGADQGQTEGKLGATIEEVKKLRREESKKNIMADEGELHLIDLPELSSKQKRFVPPTIEEAVEYCKHINIPELEASAFIDHHEARGWIMSNGKKMVDWKAGMRTWKTNLIKFSAKSFGSSKNLHTPGFAHPNAVRAQERYCSGELVQVGEDAFEQV